MKITLCGSTKFKATFEEWQLKLGLAGFVVYGLNGFMRQEGDVGKDANPLCTEDEKVRLDLCHLAKIEESDAVLILNVGGYIGDSTRRELMWAQLRGKEVFYLELTGVSVGRPIASLLLHYSPWPQ